MSEHRLDKKKELGQYFTKKDLWLKPQIKRFIHSYKFKTVVDPFAGNGDLLNLAKELGFSELIGFDIDPKLNWDLNDSLVKIPKVENAIVITNPPYLAKNSAKRSNSKNYRYFKNNNYEDLYQLAITKVLENYSGAVFIIPETFIRTNLFIQYIEHITILEENLFEDTECPICIVCFRRNKTLFNNMVYDIYKNDLFICDSYEIKHRLERYKPKKRYPIKFNIQNGNLGLRAVDGIDPYNRIKFCLPEELYYEKEIKESSRSITLIQTGFKINKDFINLVNYYLEDYRARTHDIFLAPFKNNNKAGQRRRRLDYKLARDLINKTIEKMEHDNEY